MDKVLNFKYGIQLDKKTFYQLQEVITDQQQELYSYMMFLEEQLLLIYKNGLKKLDKMEAKQ